MTDPSLFSGSRPRLEQGPIALHYQVYRHLRAALDAGRLRTGDRLPGERELTDFYGCSIVTVRRALDELTRERRLVRMRGRGTFVTKPPLVRDLARLDSFTAEMRERGLAPSTTLLAAKEEPASATVAAALDLEPGTPALLLERLRLVDSEPLLLETVHLPSKRFPGLLDVDLESESLYELLATRYDTRLEFAKETIEPVALSARVARLLGQPRSRPALRLELIAFDAGQRPVEYCVGVVRGDRARYHVEAHGPRAGHIRVTDHR